MTSILSNVGGAGVGGTAVMAIVGFALPMASAPQSLPFRIRAARFKVGSLDGRLLLIHRERKVHIDDFIEVLSRSQEGGNAEKSISLFRNRLSTCAPAKLTDIDVDEDTIEYQTSACQP